LHSSRAETGGLWLPGRSQVLVLKAPDGEEIVSVDTIELNTSDNPRDAVATRSLETLNGSDPDGTFSIDGL